MTVVLVILAVADQMSGHRITLDSSAELLSMLSDVEQGATARRLRVELAEREASWRQLAACRGMDINIFYTSEQTRSTALRQRQVKAAQGICQRCPVIVQCLLWALTKPELYGIWGGMTATERARRR